MAGRSFQIGSISEAFVFSLISFSASAFSSVRASARLYVSPFSPTVCPFLIRVLRTPGWSGFRATSFEKLDTCPFQLGRGLQEIAGVGPSPALSAVITTVPAEPVNPEIHSRYSSSQQDIHSCEDRKSE